MRGELNLQRQAEPGRRSSSRIGDDGRLTGEATVKQTDFGIKPYSALFGTLKVADEVEIEIDAKPQLILVDRLRVEPALDTGRECAGAVRVERHIGDGLRLGRVGAADERAVVPCEAVG